MARPSLNRYYLLLKVFCIFDILALGPFILPGINAMNLETLSAVNVALGGTAFATFEPLHFLIARLLGIVGVAWAIWRLLNLSIRVGVFEGFARLGFSVSLFAFALQYEVPLFLALAAIDLVAGILHIFGLSLRQANQQKQGTIE